MGNCQASSSTPTPASAPIPYHRPNQGQYYYPSRPEMCYGQAPTPQNRKPTPPAVMDCNEAAERYGGFVISEYGSNLKKPTQGWVPYTSTTY